MKTSNGEWICSRREFTALSVGLMGTAMAGFSQNTMLTAGQVIDRIKEHPGTVLPKVDVIVAGEQREWEGVEYAFDANTAGDRKGMILVGHWVSEDQGMRLCADWLKSFISEVSVEWIPAGDPFWRP